MLHAAQCVSLVTESCTAGSCSCWRDVLDEACFASKGKLGSEGRKQSRDHTSYASWRAEPFSRNGLDTAKKAQVGQAMAAHAGDRTVTLPPFPSLLVPAASFLIWLCTSPLLGLF